MPIWQRRQLWRQRRRRKEKKKKKVRQPASDEEAEVPGILRADSKKSILRTPGSKPDLSLAAGFYGIEESAEINGQESDTSASPPPKKKKKKLPTEFSFGTGITSTPGKPSQTHNDSTYPSAGRVINMNVSNNSKFEVNPITGKILTAYSLSRLRDEITRFQISGTFTKDQRNQCIDEEQKEQLLDRCRICVNSALEAELGSNTADQVFDLPHDRFFRIALIVYQDNAMISEEDIVKRISAEILALHGWENLTGTNFRELEF